MCAAPFVCKNHVKTKAEVSPGRLAACRCRKICLRCEVMFRIGVIYNIDGKYWRGWILVTGISLRGLHKFCQNSVHLSFVFVTSRKQHDNLFQLSLTYS